VAAAVPHRVAGPFSRGSGRDVMLSVGVVDAAAAGIATPATVQGDHLQRSLEAVTGQQPGAPKVTHIGLLLAVELQPRPDFFRLMFDGDFIQGQRAAPVRQPTTASSGMRQPKSANTDCPSRIPSHRWLRPDCGAP